MPGATYAAMALAASAVPCRLSEVMFFEPMFVRREQRRAVQLLLSRQTDGVQQFEVFSAPGDATESAWTLHSRGVLESLPPAAARHLQLNVLRDKLSPLSPDIAYAKFALARGLWSSGRDRRRARALAEEAHALYAGTIEEQRRVEIERWLAERR